MKSFARLILLGFSFFVAMTAYGELNFDNPFQFEAKFFPEAQSVEAHWTIPAAHYLYLNHLKIESAQDIKLGKMELPKANKMVESPDGQVPVYDHSFNLKIPVIIQGKQPKLVVHYQGCAEQGICFPPVSQQLTLNENTGAIDIIKLATSDIDTEKEAVSAESPTPAPIATPRAAPTAEDDDSTSYLSKLLQSNNLLLIIVGFLGVGLLLAFTPCVLPMIPILSGIIVGEAKQMNVKRAFMLSLTYVLSMASTYAIAGILAAKLGSNIQQKLQSPWVIGFFSGIFVLLALSLFDFYDLRLPNFISRRLTHFSQKQKQGSYLGVAIMGCLACLIVSPCVSPPLVFALSYISQTGNVVLGGIALFCMGLGMGIPLIIVGTTEGKLLPKAGRWMHGVKNAFGVMMLGVSISLIGRLLAPNIVLGLWSALLVITGIYLGALEANPHYGWSKFWKGFGFLALCYGILLLIGAASGAEHPLEPLQKFTFVRGITPQAEETHWIKISKLAQLQTYLKQAKQTHQVVLVDFYADWCNSCKLNEQNVFHDEKVSHALENGLSLQVDLTKNDAEAQEIEHYFHVIGPPAILFFSDGHERDELRINGETKPGVLIKRWERAQDVAPAHQ